jgi:DNA-binding CsgD family transcriptional regulator
VSAHEPERPHRVAVVAADAPRRQAWIRALRAAPHTDVVAWADAVATLLVLGTRVDVCVCESSPGPQDAARLRDRGARVVVVPPGQDPADAVPAEVSGAPTPYPADRRPQLAPRQREVLVAYVSGNDLLPTVARRLGMQRETFKTHLRRIRGKYQEVGRPAPTRRDLYVRAVEDGLIPPPHGDGRHRWPESRPPRDLPGG